jgi:hypothetical protein
VLVLVERDGLTSCALFFLDRPGPVVERAEAVVLRDGLLGDDSREGLGEFAADGVRFGSNFFVGGFEDVEVSRAGLDAFAAVCSLPGAAVISVGSAVSCVAPDMGVKGLSSMMRGGLFSLPVEGEENSNRAATARIGFSPDLAWVPVSRGND